MGFRFRKRFKLFPGFWLNLSKSGISASAGVPGLTFNSRGRVTAGIPGTGISYVEEFGSKPRSVRERRQAQKPRLPSTEEQIRNVMDILVGPRNVGDGFWRQGLIQMVIDYDDTPRNVREAALLLKSPEAAELHMRRARGKAATLQASSEVLHAADLIIDWTAEMGWTEYTD